MSSTLTITVNNDAMLLIVTENLHAAKALILTGASVKTGLNITTRALEIQRAVVAANEDVSGENITLTVPITVLASIKEVATVCAETLADSPVVEEIMHALALADALDLFTEACTASIVAEAAKLVPPTQKRRHMRKGRTGL